MPRSVFVSYSHKQGDWVWNRLVPVLKAADVEVFFDKERFRGGLALPAQIEEWQSKAEASLLVLSPDYLKSAACQDEMARALAQDPKMTAKPPRTVPVLREACTLPPELAQPNALYRDLRQDRSPAGNIWDLLLGDLEARLSPSPPAWLEARDEARRFLDSRQSFNLEIGMDVAWRPLLKHLKEEHFPDLALVDLHAAPCSHRQGFVQELLRQCGASGLVPEKPRDLTVLHNFFLQRKPPARVVFKHFDAVARPERLAEYEYNLFMALHHLLMDQRAFQLVAVSVTPAAELFPKDHPFSNLDLKTVPLKA